MSHETKTRIVILGGGFAGVYAAMALDKQIAKIPNVDVLLINRDNFLLFTPMLHEVAASDLDATHIVNPIQKLLKRVRFFCGSVDRIDLEKKSLTISHGLSDHSHEINYDHLVVCLGSVTNFYKLPGLEERALTMKSLEDAIQVRSRMISLLEEADFDCSKEFRKRLLTVVVAGGGFAGVETIASINDFLHEAVEFYPNLKAEHLRLVLVNSGDVVLPELSDRLGRYTQKVLAKQGVEIHCNAKVASVRDNLVCLTTGEEIEAATLIWTAGTSPNPLLQTLTCKKERGRIVVDEFLAVPGHPGVWAMGDCAHIVDKKTGKPYPPTAQHAIREGKIVAANIIASIRGEKLRPFVFTTLGQLASLGHRRGVANILGVNFSGFIAWFLWRTIYLLKLPRLEKKIRVALDWTLDLVFSKDLAQYVRTRPLGMISGANTLSAHEGIEKNVSEEPVRALAA